MNRYRKHATILIAMCAQLALAAGGCDDQGPPIDQSGGTAARPVIPTMTEGEVEQVLQQLQLEQDRPEPNGSWPGFRGPGRDNIVNPGGVLLGDWPANGPEVLWELTGLGQGYSGPAVSDGLVFFHDYFYDQEHAAAVRAGTAREDLPENRSEWIVRCVRLDDGHEVWRWSYRRLISPNHGITRTVPALTENRVISFDPKIVLHGIDRVTGEEVWNLDVSQRWGTRPPAWFNGQCPLIDEGKLIVGVGGPGVLMAAIDPNDGAILWETPNPDNQEMTHASVMVAELAGVRQYIWCTFSGLVGVRASDGELLWTHPFKVNTAVASSPLPIGDRMVFMTSGYQAGSIMLHVEQINGEFVVERMWTLDYGQFESECHTPILFDRSLYGVDMQGRLARIGLNGQVLWRHETEHGFGLGPFLMTTGGQLIMLEGDTGILRLLDVSIDGASQQASADMFDGDEVEAWAPMAMVNGRLLLRSLTGMKCVDLGVLSPDQP